MTQLIKCLSLLEHSWFNLLELSLDDKLFVEIESALAVLKIDELAIRASPPFIPPKELLKNIWGTRLVVLEAVLPDAGQSCHVYQSMFANEILEINLEYTHSPTDRKDYFSALPYEIRELIYENLLIAKKEIYPLPAYGSSCCGTRIHTQYNKPGLEKHITVALLRTSRLLHQESSSTLYGENVFKLESCEKNSITDWLSAIGDRNRGHLKFLRLDHDKLLRDSEMYLSLPVEPPMVCTYQSLMGSTLAKKTHDIYENLLRAVHESIDEVSKAIAADYVSTLELLTGIPSLSRLEMIVPCHYSFSDPDFDDDGSMRSLEKTYPCPALVQQTIDGLPNIPLANELILEMDHLSSNLARTLERMDLARVRIQFTDKRDWMLDEMEVTISPELLDTGSDWHNTLRHGIILRSFRPIQRSKVEKRIEGIWPSPEEHYLFCTSDCESCF